MAASRGEPHAEPVIQEWRRGSHKARAGSCNWSLTDCGVNPLGAHMERSPAGKRRTAISGGLGLDFAAKLRWACGASRSHGSLLETATPDELLDAVATTDAGRPVTVILAGTWLKGEGLQLLTELRQVRRDVITLVVGFEFGSLALGHALRFGVRGLADLTVSAAQLSKALVALAEGEVWISRRRLVEAVDLVPEPAGAATREVWLNLPTLTERERDVLMQVLDGKPNKLIARQLDISEQTVKIHAMHVYRKLGVKRRVELLKALSLSRGSPPGPFTAAI